MIGAWSPRRISWSLRKARLPIKATDLVLDVGSGASPHPAADVLLEKFVDSRHRHSPLVSDRPMVLADACRMPFRDKAFDYVIAFHVLEHMAEPDRFLNEIQRVGRAGYIEVPNILFERLVPYDVHLLEVAELNGELLINKKRSARPDPAINELELVTTSPAWRRLFYGHPQLFHVCHFWEGEIRYKVLNPEVSADWFREPSTESTEAIENAVSAKGLRPLGLKWLRHWYKRRKKRSALDLRRLVVCPGCHGDLEDAEEQVTCPNCGVAYSAVPILDFNNGRPIGAGRLAGGG